MSNRLKTEPDYATPLRSADALIVEAIERERSRIAMELHDDLGQQLTSALIVAHQLRERVGEIDPAAAELAQQLITINQRMAQASQRMAGQLQPGAAIEQGLQLALSNLSSELNQLGFSSRFVSPPNLDTLNSKTALHLFRIAQEAVNNAMKHSGSKEIDITVATDGDDRIIVSVRDAGRGFDVNEQRTGRVGQSGQSGLINMARHARIVGADLSIQSRQESEFGTESGTIVECTMLISATRTDIS